MVILEDKVFHEITDYINKYDGLMIDCEEDLIKKYPHIPDNTLRSVVSKHQRFVIMNFFGKFTSKPEVILNEYMANENNYMSILNIARELKVPPGSVARMILNEKYSKNEVKVMWKNPDLIPDPMLGANVYNCILNDSQDSAIVDMIRYCVGEEYEVKLKKLAREADLIFYDENDLRRQNYDKTPDLLTIPFMYKNQVVNWIESKAMFSDLYTHRTYYKQQLSCYENRFGTGIVIYWFGLQQAVLNFNSTKKSNIIILDDFPEKQFITTLEKFEEK